MARIGKTGGEMEESRTVLELQDRANTVAERILAGIEHGHFGSTTPCPEWDVRELANHLVGLHRMAAAAAANEPLPDWSADFLGDDARDAFATAAAKATAALAAPGGLDRTYQMPWGDMPGAGLARVLLADTAIHAWDMAKATGQLDALDPDICESVLAWGQTTMKPEYRTPESGFGPEIGVPADAPACDRLAAFYGRQP